MNCLISFDDLLALAKQKQAVEPTIFLLMGEPVSGKTIAMEELANAFEESERKVLRIQLTNVKKQIVLNDMDLADFLACAAPSYSKDEVNDCISQKNSNVFMYGLSALTQQEQDKVMKHAKTLRDEKRVHVWITSRIGEAFRDRIFYFNEGSLCIVRIKPFDERKQDQLVRLVSGGEKRFADLQSRVEEFGEEFLQNPLHLRIAVEIGDDENLFDHLIIRHKILPLFKNYGICLKERFVYYWHAVVSVKRQILEHINGEPSSRYVLYEFGVVDAELPGFSMKFIHPNICDFLSTMSDKSCIDLYWN